MAQVLECTVRYTEARVVTSVVFAVYFTVCSSGGFMAGNRVFHLCNGLCVAAVVGMLALPIAVQAADPMSDRLVRLRQRARGPGCRAERSTDCALSGHGAGGSWCLQRRARRGVAEVLVQDGDRVEAGQVLMRQDARQVQAELATAAAGVALAEAQLLASKQRLLQLQADEQAIAQAAKERAASALEAQRAQSAVQVAQADVVAQEAAIGAAKAQYEAVAVRMDDLTLRAPFAGDVVMAPAEVGAWLAEGDVALWWRAKSWRWKSQCQNDIGRAAARGSSWRCYFERAHR